MKKQLLLLTLTTLAATHSSTFSMWARLAKPAFTRVAAALKPAARTAARTVTSTKPKIVASSLLLGSGVFGLWSTGTSFKRSEKFIKPCNARKLEINNVAGEVHVQGWDKNILQVDAIARANTQKALNNTRISVDVNSDTAKIDTIISENNGDPSVTHSSNGVKVTTLIVGNMNVYSKTVTGDTTYEQRYEQTNESTPGFVSQNNIEGAQVDYTIWAPRTLAALIARNSIGKIHCNNIDGIVDAQTTTGDITTSNCPTVKANSNTGDVGVFNATTAHANSNVGTVSATQIKQKIRARSTAGDIEVRQSAGAIVDARSNIGTIRIK